MIKEALDKRFGTTWHVVVGEGFGFDISYELSRIFYMFFAPDKSLSCTLNFYMFIVQGK